MCLHREGLATDQTRPSGIAAIPKWADAYDSRMRIALRPFRQSDFAALISWVPTPDALAQWCAGFFQFPLDVSQLQEYLESADRRHAREIFTAESEQGESVGHVELSMIWPHLSCRLSRALVAPERRGIGLGRQIVGLAISRAFQRYRVSRIDLGVSDDNQIAIRCYERQHFAEVGTWPDALAINGKSINVYWMTLMRADWESGG